MWINRVVYEDMCKQNTNLLMDKIKLEWQLKVQKEEYELIEKIRESFENRLYDSLLDQVLNIDLKINEIIEIYLKNKKEKTNE